MRRNVYVRRKVAAEGGDDRMGRGEREEGKEGLLLLFLLLFLLSLLLLSSW